MTQTCHSERKLTEYDYQFLTKAWEGVAGAAYNQTYEFCKEFGWCNREGEPTPAGLAAIQAYEMEKWNI
jgi:hypothetical protein